MKKFILCGFIGMALLSLSLRIQESNAAKPPLAADMKLSLMPAECADRIETMLQEEINIYRSAQFGPSARSVLQTTAANTSDLVPYLVENYHALDCRLRMICIAAGTSQGPVETEKVIFPHRPIGCSRLFAARGRWWSPDRRDEVFRTEPIAACAFPEGDTPAHSLLPTAFNAGASCDALVDEVLREEEQMLRLVVAQDVAERGTRRVVPVFQNVLADVRESFLIPLRGMVDLFGSIVHPIPCLLHHCN